MKKKLKLLLVSMVAALLALVLLLVFTDFYLVLLGPLEAGVDVERDFGDTILVLGGGLRKGGKIGYSTEERLNLAVELYHQKKRRIIVSGGSLYKHSPAIKIIRAYLEAKGVDTADIHMEGKSQTTLDHFLNNRGDNGTNQPGGMIVCTSPYHQRRARIILDHLGLKHVKIARMKKSEIFQANSQTQRQRNLRLIMREYMAIVRFKIFKK